MFKIHLYLFVGRGINFTGFWNINEYLKKHSLGSKAQEIQHLKDLLRRVGETREVLEIEKQLEKYVIFSLLILVAQFSHIHY